MKKTFWKADWFAGVVVSLLLLGAANSEFLQGLERKAYDLGMQASSHNPGDKVAVIAIDDQSIANIGRWPWSREILAKMTDILAGAHAKVIGNTVFFVEPQLDPGLAYINKLSRFVAETSATTNTSVNTDPATIVPDTSQPSTSQLSIVLSQLGGMLKEAETTLNTDKRLADSMQKAGNVVLAMPFILGEPRGNPDKPLPDYVAKNALDDVTDNANAVELGLWPLPALSALLPIAELGSKAAAIGHLNSNADVDGAIRTEPLVIRHYDQYFPSLSLQLVARYLNLKPKDIQVKLGEGVKMGGLNIATDGALQMNTFFYADHDGKAAFPVDSFYDVYTGKIPAAKYHNKIVLIGGTAVGTGDSQVTPISPAMAPVLILAHSVASILKQDFFVAPPWGMWAERGAFLLIALYLILLLPHLKAGMAAAVSVVLLAALLATHFVLMIQQNLWLQLMLPATLLVVGHILLTTKRFLLTEQGKAKSDADSAESNRNLGLMFQGQGQLDMAFDRFRKCPMDDSIMDILYSLGLDFERKRQFNKAEAVFNYMAQYNAKYKDLEQRTARSKAMSETVLLGGAGRSNASTLILDDGSVEKPMLGRYQLEKELGKGAMGVVYLGKDPKISRVVAIKTMALSQEFEPDELVEVKERFFREAETAGRLNHPNIVTIYDAGEEHDLAYIAMEFLKGRDLAPYTKPENLLPLPKAMDIAAKVADALDYAHASNVVHRDIKPANIMYELDSGNVKVTDFGIARITDSSKTKTGMVLGTPSYMSPEQLSGKKVDGRSDLFSLGAMLYQMTTGHLPFKGESMATLMYKIANEPPPGVLTLRPDAPECLVAIIDRMLEKDVEKRYQHGAEIAKDIRQCLGQLQ